MKQSLIAGAVVALVSIVAGPQAIAQEASTPAGKSIKAGSYKVEPNHTQVLFSVSHFGFTKFSGFFSGASGTLQLDPANPAADKLDVSVPVQSVLTTSSKLDDELKGDQWFDAAKFPTATFTSKKITPSGNGTASIAGDLTLHGVTKPITLNARFVGAGVNPLSKAETVGFQATGTIKRSDFGVKTYVPLVGDKVQLNIAGAFELQQ
jgi:polyisoprenoid-binding protein YceI